VDNNSAANSANGAPSEGSITYFELYGPTYTGWHKKVSRYQMIKNRIKSYSSLSIRLDQFVKLKYESSTIIFSLVLDILCVTPITIWPAN